MTAPAELDGAALVAVARLVEQRTGMHYPPWRWPDLVRHLRDLGRAVGRERLGLLVGELLAEGPEGALAGRLEEHLPVGETYFFRERAALQAFTDEIVPSLVARRRAGPRRLRVWSAGCCTGEEPYTLAILLRRAVADLRAGEVEILGTDLSPRFLAHAERAEYRPWSFRATPEWALRGCFEPGPASTRRLKRAYRDMVTFAPLNLASGAFPSLSNGTAEVDVIFCRNVLMYLSPQVCARVIGGFLRALAPGGYLIVSATELSQQLFAPFEAVRLGGATLYRKPDAPRSLGHAPGPTSAAAPVLTAAAEQRYLAASSLVDRHPAGHPGAAPGAVSGAVSTLPPASATPAPVAPPGAADLAQRARAHADEGRLDQAQACCAEALSLCPTDPSLHYLDAVIGQSLGHTPAALEALRRAIYLEPRHVLAHFTRAHLLREAGHEAAARRHFATTAELLAQLPDDAELAEAGGVTAGNLAVVVAAVRGWQPQGVAAGNG